MDAGHAHGFALTATLAASGLTDDHLGPILRDLSHLQAIRGSEHRPGEVTIHCLVFERDEHEAVRYVIQRALAALLAVGLANPAVLSVEATDLEAELARP